MQDIEAIIEEEIETFVNLSVFNVIEDELNRYLKINELLYILESDIYNEK